MPKASPNLEDRLAKIELGIGAKKPPQKSIPSVYVSGRRSPKKKLPPQLQPQSTPGRQLTPSKQPYLSTARRAEARSARNVPVTPSKIVNVTTPSRTKTIEHGRDSSPGEKSRSGDDAHSFSFMKETSSSAMKKCILSTPNAYKTTTFKTSPTPTDQPVLKPTPEFQHKKRNQSSARRSLDLRPRKRVVSTNKPLPPVDITNYHFSVPTSAFKMDLPMDTVKPLVKRSDSNQSLTSFRTSIPRSSSHSSQLKLQIPRSTSKKSVLLAPETLRITPISHRIDTIPQLYGHLYGKNSQVFDTVENTTYDEQKSLNVQTLTLELGVYEKGEILRQNSVYYVAPTPKEKQFNIRNGKENFGFDDKQGNLILRKNDHINYRYQIDRVLGTGSFGNVVLCHDHKYVGKSPKPVAIKIIKNNLEWTLQAVSEIKILKNLSKSGGSDTALHYLDHFHFRGHMCIVSEVLSLNLFSVIEMTDFSGFSLDLVSLISSQIAQGLAFIHLQNIVHCDIKPENIMLKLPHDFDPDSQAPQTLSVKIIDFGSSCYNDQAAHTYIQSRFYRAPEVIIGATYSSAIDIWSLGCVSVELFTGSPLFLGKNDLEQFALIVESFGIPSRRYIQQMQQKMRRKNQNRRPTSSLSTELSIPKSLLFTLFDTDGKLNLQLLNMRLQVANTYGVKRSVRPNSKSLDVQLKLNSLPDRRQVGNFLRYLKGVFRWNSDERVDATQLVNDVFLQQPAQND